MNFLLLSIGVAACAASVILIKGSGCHPVALAGWRLVLAAGLLTPVMLRAWREDGRSVWRLIDRSWPGAVLLAVHFITWAWGAKHTSAAHGTLIVNLVPVTMPFLLYLAEGDRITLREVLGSAVSLAGVVYLSLQAKSNDSAASLEGDVLCFVAMVLVALYMLVSRLRSRDRLPDGRATSLFLYVVPLYWMAGVTCFVICLFWPGAGYLLPPREDLPVQVLWLLGLAVIPTIIGHSLLNHCMRVMRAQIVAVVLAYVIYREVPGAKFYVSAVLVLAGALIVLLAPPPRKVPDAGAMEE
jgi:drug/metabolite transporter (DMT)-like permease